jgi:flagellar basal body rod protein FlgB
MRRTNDKHLGQPDPDAAVTTEAEGLASRRDGNNVQVDRELLAMTKAQGDFSRAQTALAAKFRLVRYAINEGR